MSREIKLGILAIVAIASLIWGYKFLMGKNIFSNSNHYFIEYSNIDQLALSDPVMISGYQVGTVQGIQLKAEDFKTVVVRIDVMSDVKLPQNTIAQLRSDGVMGGKTIILDYEGVCDQDCLESGSHLKAAQFGLIASMVNPAELDQYMVALKSGLTGVIDTLNTQLTGDPDSEVAATAQSFAQTIKNLEEATNRMNYLFQASTGKLISLLDNLDVVTRKLRDSSGDIGDLIHNVSEITIQLKSSRIDSTVMLANQAISSSGATMESMTATLAQTEKTIAKLDEMLAGINRGEGTLGSLAHDRELYENVNQATIDLRLLLEDFREHPKRYFSSFLLGKKEKPYVAPEIDPVDQKMSLPKNDSTN